MSYRKLRIFHEYSHLFQSNSKTKPFQSNQIIQSNPIQPNQPTNPISFHFYRKKKATIVVNIYDGIVALHVY